MNIVGWTILDFFSKYGLEDGASSRLFEREADVLRQLIENVFEVWQRTEICVRRQEEFLTSHNWLQISFNWQDRYGRDLGWSEGALHVRVEDKFRCQWPVQFHEVEEREVGILVVRALQRVEADFLREAPDFVPISELDVKDLPDWWVRALQWAAHHPEAWESLYPLGGSQKDPLRS